MEDYTIKVKLEHNIMFKWHSFIGTDYYGAWIINYFTNKGNYVIIKSETMPTVNANNETILKKHNIINDLSFINTSSGPQKYVILNSFIHSLLGPAIINCNSSEHNYYYIYGEAIGDKYAWMREINKKYPEHIYEAFPHFMNND